MWYKNKVLLSLFILTLVFTLSFGMVFNDYLVLADEVSDTPELLEDEETESTTDSVLDLSEGEEPVDDSEGEEPVDGSDGEEPVDDSDVEEPVDDSDGEEPVDGSEGEEPVDDPDEEEPALATDQVDLSTVEPSLELSMITLDGEDLEGFDSQINKYEVKLSEGSTILPKVTGRPVVEEMPVSYDIDELNSVVKIQVGPNENCAIYELKFIGLELTTAVEPPIGVWGMWLPPTEDDFVLEKRSTKIRFWMQTPILYPAIWIYETDGGGALGDKVLEISTSDLKINNGGGKHSKVDSVNTFEEGYYQFNLKGKNCTTLEVGQLYALAVINGDEIVEFKAGEPAILEFEVGFESNNTVIKQRNKDYNQSSRRSNVSGNR